jgi:hypothetical protein
MLTLFATASVAWASEFVVRAVSFTEISEVGVGAEQRLRLKLRPVRVSETVNVINATPDVGRQILALIVEKFGLPEFQAVRQPDLVNSTGWQERLWIRNFSIAQLKDCIVRLSGYADIRLNNNTDPIGWCLSGIPDGKLYPPRQIVTVRKAGSLKPDASDSNVRPQLPLGTAPRFYVLANGIKSDEPRKERFHSAGPKPPWDRVIGFIAGVSFGLLIWAFDWLRGKCG